jgi:protein-disulfide isomerase
MRRPSPTVLAAAGAVVVAVVVAIVLAVVLTGSSGSSLPKNLPAHGSLTNALPGGAEVHTLLAGIPQHGNILGSPTAPATMVEYVDLQCPYCRAFETSAFPTLVSRYVRTGKLKIEARILDFIGPDSVRGRLAAIAAGQQNKLFNFTEILYANQGTENTGWLSDTMVANTAASIPGLDVRALLDGRGSGTVKDEAKRFDSLAKDGNVRSTPTVLVGKNPVTANPVALSSPTDVQTVEKAIDAALR